MDIAPKQHMYTIPDVFNELSPLSDGFNGCARHAVREKRAKALVVAGFLDWMAIRCDRSSVMKLE